MLTIIDRDENPDFLNEMLENQAPVLRRSKRLMEKQTALAVSSCIILKFR